MVTPMKSVGLKPDPQARGPSVRELAVLKADPRAAMTGIRCRPDFRGTPSRR
jgi:hypothetical protein